MCRRNERGGRFPKAPSHLLIMAGKAVSQVDDQRSICWGWCCVNWGKMRLRKSEWVQMAHLFINLPVKLKKQEYTSGIPFIWGHAQTVSNKYTFLYFILRLFIYLFIYYSMVREAQSCASLTTLPHLYTEYCTCTYRLLHTTLLYKNVGMSLHILCTV